MIAEWIPVNPCEECGRRISECRYPSDHCEREYIYKGKLSAQRKLIEYLRSQALLDWNVADPMLKQLEKGQ